MIWQVLPLHQDDLVVNVFAFAIGHGFAPQVGHTKDHYRIVQSPYVLGMQDLG